MGFIKTFAMLAAFVFLTLLFGMDNPTVVIPGMVVLFLLGMVGGVVAAIPICAYGLAFAAMFLMGGIPFLGPLMMSNIMPWGIGSIIIALTSGLNALLGRTTGTQI